MIQHAIFPTLIGEFKYDHSEEFKNVFFNKFYDHVDDLGDSSERTGHVTIHHEPAFKPLYQFIYGSLKEFISAYKTDPEKMDIYIVKSWLNVIRNVQTPYHNHADAHISFVYYVNVPNDIVEPIRFFTDIQGRYAPYPGFCKFANHFDEWNLLNSICWEFNPSDGHLLVFPAEIPHDTQLKNGKPSDDEYPNYPLDVLRQKRIAIAGDVIITFKEKAAIPMGLQPIKNWRKF